MNIKLFQKQMEPGSLGKNSVVMCSATVLKSGGRKVCFEVLGIEDPLVHFKILHWLH